MGNGLTTEEEKTIAAVFAQVPAIERAVLFGSRAMGLARGNSDVDIALYGEKLGLPDILYTASLLEDTPLPYQFDLISYASITSPDLLEHIRQYGKEMYRKESNPQKKCSSEKCTTPDSRTLRNLPKTGGQSGLISEAYKKMPLYNLAIWRNGLAFRNIQFSPTGKPVIKIAELKNGITDQTKFTQDTFDDSVALRAGDMVFSWSGNPETSIDVFYYDLPDGWLNQHIFKVTPVGVNKDFLFYLLKYYKPTFTAIASNKQTTGLGHVTVRDLKELIVDVPSPQTQKNIAAILSSFDGKIENNRKINQCLEQMAQAMFDRLIIEESIDEPLGVLADIAEINPPRILKRGQNAAYVEMANLPTQGAFPNNWEIKSFTGGMKFKNGDTILARISPCLQNGKTAYINFLNEGEVAFGSTEYIVISSKKDYCNEMFYFLARYPDFVSYAVGNMNGSSGRQRVAGNTLENYELHIPTKENVRKFAMFATPVMNIILQKSLENRNLAALRDALLPRLMSGELSVGDVEAS